jgi:hypothetical protein
LFLFAFFVMALDYVKATSENKKHHLWDDNLPILGFYLSQIAIMGLAYGLSFISTTWEESKGITSYFMLLPSFVVFSLWFIVSFIKNYYVSSVVESVARTYKPYSKNNKIDVFVFDSSLIKENSEVKLSQDYSSLSVGFLFLLCASTNLFGYGMTVIGDVLESVSLIGLVFSLLLVGYFGGYFFMDRNWKYVLMICLSLLIAGASIVSSIFTVDEETGVLNPAYFFFVYFPLVIFILVLTMKSLPPYKTPKEDSINGRESQEHPIA